MHIVYTIMHSKRIFDNIKGGIDVLTITANKYTHVDTYLEKKLKRNIRTDHKTAIHAKRILIDWSKAFVGMIGL